MFSLLLLNDLPHSHFLRNSHPNQCEADMVTSSQGILGRPSHNVRNSRSSRIDPDCVKVAPCVRLHAATLNLVHDFIRFTPRKVRLASKLVRLLKRLGRRAGAQGTFFARYACLSFGKKRKKKSVEGAAASVEMI